MLKNKTSIFHELIFNLEKNEAYRLVQIAKFNSLNKNDQLNELENENSIKDEQIDDKINPLTLNPNFGENDVLIPKKS